MSKEITIFSKKRTNNEGRTFYNYLTRLTRKNTGESQMFTVKFRDDTAPDPEECPINIIVEKEDLNCVQREFVRKDGNPGVGYTLWVAAFKPGSPYVDHSLDDFDI